MSLKTLISLKVIDGFVLSNSRSDFLADLESVSVAAARLQSSGEGAEAFHAHILNVSEICTNGEEAKADNE